MTALYYVQVINHLGGEYGAERTPVSVNRRMAVTAQGPEHWYHTYPDLLWKHIEAAPRNSAGMFDEQYSWIKE